MAEEKNFHKFFTWQRQTSPMKKYTNYHEYEGKKRKQHTLKQWFKKAYIWTVAWGIIAAVVLVYDKT